jgi:hypothetical protein
VVLFKKIYICESETSYCFEGLEPEWGIVLHTTVSDVNSTKDKPVKAILLARFCKGSCAERDFTVESRRPPLGHI